jgi:hypothetical protein
MGESFPFVLGLILIVSLSIKDNLPRPMNVAGRKQRSSIHSNHTSQARKP